MDVCVLVEELDVIADRVATAAIDLRANALWTPDMMFIVHYLDMLLDQYHDQGDYVRY